MAKKRFAVRIGLGRPGNRLGLRFGEKTLNARVVFVYARDFQDAEKKAVRQVSQATETGPWLVENSWLA